MACPSLNTIFIFLWVIDELLTVTEEEEVFEEEMKEAAEEAAEEIAEDAVKAEAAAEGGD